MSLFIAIVLGGLATYLTRLSFIALAGRMQPPAWLPRLLRFVPVAALTALIWPDLLLVAGQLNFAGPRLYAGLIAAFVAWKTGNIFFTIGIGMVALWLIQGVL
jgi:branched-subunit amino acid transport protein